ncbi:MAG TPA: PEP-CTERM sorting domain-containing protein [Accumulibacter sp.]|uniref:PEP-CTERM sorting domain-containing protein n=1 Tax=Accumulibacter sp. TaxID=2053492 RepID=UPI0028783378|nr:PEP-CTERM sorting domain-containing protein [Accumulibacter sp.]MDS4055838.1 PEP-CTERM sorting domain-containing protein [Accumulibacter sp.]HNK04783.1 PEP-CTERM sorting domain-containing protein [Accumulibacter sp.]
MLAAVVAATSVPQATVADHSFLTSDTPSGAAVSRYFAIQFESPISFFILTMIGYANGVGGVGPMDGDFEYSIGKGPFSQSEPRSRPDFNIAVLRLDTPDSSVGFDNLIIGGHDVPEPAAWSLLAAGLGLLSFSLAKGRRG